MIGENNLIILIMKKHSKNKQKVTDDLVLICVFLEDEFHVEAKNTMEDELLKKKKKS